MDNSAFRELMEKARAAPPKEKGPAPQPGTGKKKGPSQGSAKYQKMLAFKAKQKEQQEETNKYRDRAEERKKGLNKDYDNDVQKLLEVDIEKSKYLGGDVEHTHLVKGLDFALLTKVRGELETQKQEASKVEQDNERKRKMLKTAKIPKGFQKGAGRALSAAQVLPSNLGKTGGGGALGSAGDKWSTLSTRTHMGKAIGYFLSRSEQRGGSTGAAAARAAAAVAGGKRVNMAHETIERMAFEFTLPAAGLGLVQMAQIDAELDELPTTVSRPRDGAARDDDEPVLAMLDDEMLTRLSTKLVEHRAGKKHKKRSREQAKAQARKKGVGKDYYDESDLKDEPKRGRHDDPDDSIFGDVGAYVPAGAEDDDAGASSSSAAGGRGGGGGGGGIFDGLRVQTAAERDAAEKEAAESKPDLGAIMKSVKGLAQQAARMDARKEGKIDREAGATDPSARGNAMAGPGDNYGEDYDYDFAGDREYEEQRGSGGGGQMDANPISKKSKIIDADD